MCLPLRLPLLLPRDHSYQSNPHIYAHTPLHTQQPAGVTAHHVAVGDGQRDKTVFLIKFRQDVLRREAALSS